MGHFIRACIAAVSTLFAAAVPAQSQSLSEPVTVGWAEVRPLFYGDEDGNPAGFGIDLARLIAKRADITLSFRRFDTPEGMIRAQAAGEVDLLPAIAALPGLAERNIFSDPV
ncbi:MAG: transporter substrate-binding domain-containing protein, partial [Pseudomonadota bacterium]